MKQQTLNNTFKQIAFSLLLGVFFFPAISFGQTRGTLEVIKDPLIDTLIAKRPVVKNSVTNIGGEETAYGYRVQIFFGSSRQAAYNAQAKFREDHPGLSTYVSYNDPNFKVQAGDFRTRLEAEKLKRDVAGQFTSLFIISGKINPAKSDTTQ